jgi:16S rRNA (uracil1498-N3)-methyltransferase
MGWPADAAASAHLFVESAAELTDVVDVCGEDGHHLARVLRLRVGETVTVADGSGGWRPYRIGGVGAVVRLDATSGPEREPALSPGLAVAFALTKGDKPELVVQKLTELGVDRILPVAAERSVARLDAARAGTAGERWCRIAREAARQCRRARLPVVEDLRPLVELTGHPAIVVAARGGGPAAALASPPGGEILAVVGPEGGLTGAEVEALAPWGRLGLGPHVLRAETAALAAATVLGAGRAARAGGKPGD